MSTPATGSVGHSWGLSVSRVEAAAAVTINTTIIFIMLLGVPLVIIPVRP